jgi:Tfp pilus assembly protein PilN
MAVDAGAVLAEAAHTRLALVLDNPDAGPGETVFAGPGAGDMFRLCSGGARALDADDVPSVADALREDAASGEADSFNLLSDEWRERRRRAQWRRQAVRGLLIAAGVYAVALVAYGAASLAQSARLAGLDRQIKQSQPEFAEARTVRHALQMLESRLDTQQTALEALLEASVQLPQSVRLTGFKFKKNETLTLRGETASASLALDYIGKLGQSPLFDNVKTVSMPTTPEGLTTFEVICRLKPVSSLAGGKS